MYINNILVFLEALIHTPMNTIIEFIYFVYYSFRSKIIIYSQKAYRLRKY